MKKYFIQIILVLTCLNLTGISFAYFIKGYIEDDNGTKISSVTVSLTGATTASYVTGSDGYYEFLDIDTGNYTVTPTRSGWNFVPVNFTYEPLNSNRSSQNFLAVPVTYYIKGYLRDNRGAGIEGATVTLSGDDNSTCTTDGNGYYEFLNLSEGNYSVIPSKGDRVFFPENRDYSPLDTNQDSQNFIGSKCYYIRGYIRNSAGTGIGSVNVKLTLPGGVEKIYITDSTGYYEFLKLLPEGYIVTPGKDNYTFSPMEMYYPLLIMDLDNEDYIGGLEKIDEGKNFFKPINNLFNPDNNEKATVWYNLLEAGQVIIRIYTLDGILAYTLTDEYKEKGIHAGQWNGKNSAGEVVAQGTYLVHIEAPGFRDTKKIIVIR